MKTRRSRDWQREEEELMKTRFYFALLFLLLLGTGTGSAQSTNAGNGVWWDSLSADSKSHFVEGYIAAMRRVNHVLHKKPLSRPRHSRRSGPRSGTASPSCRCVLNCPTGFSFRVLFQPTNLIPVKQEVHLPQALPWSNANWIAFSIQLNDAGVFHESLPPQIQ